MCSYSLLYLFGLSGFIHTSKGGDNNESINLCHLLNKENKIFEYAHLLGMNEKKYTKLVKEKENVHVYIPYGPYKYMIPYLTRRLYENIDTIKYM